jgi:acetyl esterase/lipase
MPIILTPKRAAGPSFGHAVAARPPCTIGLSLGPVRTATVFGMTTSPPFTRRAAVQLRGTTGPIWARIYWPPGSGPGRPPPPLLIYFAGSEAADADPECRQLCLRGGLVILAGPSTTPYDVALADAQAIVGWAADHATELEADPARLLISGRGDGLALATEVSRIAGQEGWPELLLLTDLATTLERTNR